MPNFIQNQTVDNYLSGRQFADQEKASTQIARARDQQYEQNILNQQRETQALDEAQKQKFATQMVQAAQYGMQSNNPKAFIEQNYPQLAQLAGPKWATATDDDVKQSLQDAIGKFGPMAGIGPAQPKERALINTVGPDGKPVRGEDKPGAPVYVPPEKAPPRFRPMSPVEIKAAGLPPGASAQVNDTTGQIQVLDKPPDGPSARGTFKDTQALRKEFDNLPEVKNYKLVLPLYERAKNAPNTRAGDLSIIYALGKMFDPGSVVREGELILAQNTAPWLVNLASRANSQLSGSGALDKETRANIIAALDGQKQALEAPYNQERERFAGYANENGWSPESVVGKFKPSEAFNTPPAASGAAQPAEITATGPKGEKIVLRNGQWVPL